MNNKALNLKAYNQLKQPLTALAKTKTFVWVHSKVRRQIKHVHLWKKHQLSQFGNLLQQLKPSMTSEFEIIQRVGSKQKQTTVLHQGWKWALT